VWLLILFGVLVYPTLHFAEWLLPTGPKRLTYSGSILLLAMFTLGFGKIALPEILRPTSTTVVPALRKLSEINPSLSETAIRVGSAVASTVNIDLPKEMRDKVLSSVPDRSTWTFGPIAANTGPDNYQTIGLARQPDVAVMERIDTHAPKLSEYGPAFLVVKGLTATLDDFHLKNVVFQDMRLIYHGGPLILENAYFFRCEFRFDPNEQSWRLLSTIASGGWVTGNAGVEPKASTPR
jgi:hypothetical protein